MGRAQKCIVVCNTRNGYCMSPHHAESISSGVRWAKSMRKAYRIFLENGTFVRSGSFRGKN